VGFELKKVTNVVDSAVNHHWGVPEFQRGFVWTRQKVRDLADSLWRGYPVGSFLLWYAPDQVEPRVVSDGVQPSGWLVDGQQRSTALCILFGRKPYWWGGEWNKMVERHDLRFNVMAEEDPYFQLASGVMKKQPEWVEVRTVLNAGDDALAAMVQKLIGQLEVGPGDFGKLYTRLNRVRQIRDADVPVVTVTLDLEEVTEIFARLNSAGTKVTEADIALALAASQNPGWARDHFLPFVAELDEAGFDVDPNLVFRSMVSIGLGRAVLKDVPSSYWSSVALSSDWAKTQTAWRHTIAYIEDRGLLSADVMPTKNALIPLVVLIHRHPAALTDGRAFAWFLHATRVGRYGGSAITSVQSDVRAIVDADKLDDALLSLHKRLAPWEPFEAADFLTPYTDRVLRLFLYLVMFDRNARDWMTGQRLGFTGQELLQRFNPQWHHIHPRAYLKAEGVPEEEWDRFANIAVIAPTTNIKIGAKSPPDYLAKYGIVTERLTEQLIEGEPASLVTNNYLAFLATRAQAIADAANGYVGGLANLTPFQTAVDLETS